MAEWLLCRWSRKFDVPPWKANLPLQRVQMTLLSASFLKCCHTSDRLRREDSPEPDAMAFTRLQECARDYAHVTYNGIRITCISIRITQHSNESSNLSHSSQHYYILFNRLPNAVLLNKSGLVRAKAGNFNSKCLNRCFSNYYQVRTRPVSAETVTYVQRERYMSPTPAEYVADIHSSYIIRHSPSWRSSGNYCLLNGFIIKLQI